MKYDSQVIVYFGDGSGDTAAQDNAERLIAKAVYDGVLDKTTVIKLNGSGTSSWWDLNEDSGKITDNSRVYFVGHGTENSCTFGGCNPVDMAKTVKSLVPSGKTIKRLSLVGCHTGGDGNVTAPHRYVSALWKEVKGCVFEITGYTGQVAVTLSRFASKPTNPHQKYGAYESWSGQTWWIAEGTGRKTVSHEHDEGDNSRKIYIRSEGTFSTGWTNKL